MKKGVFGSIVWIFVLLLSFLFVLPISFAGLNEEERGEGAGGDVIPVGTAPRSSGVARGYWIAEDEQLYAYQGPAPGTYYLPLGGTNPLTLLEGQSLPTPVAPSGTFFERINVQERADGTPWTLDPSKIYSDFRVPEGHEVRHVRFVLDTESFSVGEGEAVQYFPSHAGEPTFAWYQDPCVECSSIDDPESCDRPLPYDATCIGLNILNRDDCSDMSDFGQQFCEGVVGIAPNIDILIGNVGTAGYGGCRLVGVDDTTSADVARNFGRDWLADFPEPANWFSPDFTFASEGENKKLIGDCCGNDLMDDPGALVKQFDRGETLFPNKYICVNSTKGDFLWLDAQGVENFKIYYVQNRSHANAPYAVVSNTNNWFVCNTDKGGSNLEAELYAPLVKDASQKRSSGVLMEEYEILPRPEPLLARGTEFLGGEEAGGDGVRGGGQPPGERTGETEGYADSVDEDSFLGDIDQQSISGAGRITACDKDGDGYDGNWSADPIAGSWHDTTADVCEDPQPLFDCDEGNLDDSFYPGSYLPDRKKLFGRMRHPGRINYCIDGENYHLDCDFSNPSCITEPGSNVDAGAFNASPNAEFLYPRFMCHNVDGAGDFAECCGWSLQFCFNKQQGRREGAFIHTLRDFSYFMQAPDESDEIKNMRATKNYVLRYGINKAPPPEEVLPDEEPYTLLLTAEGNELNITDWSHYKSFDFYIWFTTNFEVELWLGKRKPETVQDIFANFLFPYKLRIVDYVVNEPELMKWLHVSIPIEDITTPGFTPDVILFASDVTRLSELGSSVWANNIKGERKEFSNIIGVDKIHFRPKDYPADPHKKLGDENFVCTGTWPPTWVSNLDSTATVGGAPMGRDACESIPSYGWTGTKCCGDDTGKNTTPGTIGPATFKEFYADTDAGCWAGNILANGSRIMLVKYNLSYSGRTREVVHSCRSESCIYDLPPIKNVLVTNGNPEVYDLYLVNGGSNFVGRGALTSTNHSYLRVDSVPLQVLYFNSNFWSCNAAKFVNETKNETDGFLIPISNRVTSTGDKCEVRGGYFCDHIEGANSGWNGEGLIRYPGMNITLADGTQKDLGEGSTVAAEFRESTKRNYNLIRNGGFENVQY
jgi:hypothetical protein